MIEPQDIEVDLSFLAYKSINANYGLPKEESNAHQDNKKYNEFLYSASNPFHGYSRLGGAFNISTLGQSGPYFRNINGKTLLIVKVKQCLKRVPRKINSRKVLINYKKKSNKKNSKKLFAFLLRIFFLKYILP